MIRLLLVDDQPLVRAGLARIYRPRHGFEVVGECGDGAAALEAVPRLRPDVVLMEMRMKGMGGAEAIRRLQELPDPPPVLIITTLDDDEVVRAGLGAGAAGYVLKDASGPDLIRAARTVAEGGAWLDPSIIPQILHAYRTTVPLRAAVFAQLAELTARELDVLRLTARGATNREIADELFISEGTVKSHVGHIFSKLGLRDRAAAIVLAFDHGLVAPEAATAPLETGPAPPELKIAGSELRARDPKVVDESDADRARHIDLGTGEGEGY